MAVCFAAADSSAIVSAAGNELVPPKRVAGCLSVTVIRCRYAALEGQGLQDVAAFYRRRACPRARARPRARAGAMRGLVQHAPGVTRWFWRRGRPVWRWAAR